MKQSGHQSTSTPAPHAGRRTCGVRPTQRSELYSELLAKVCGLITPTQSGRTVFTAIRPRGAGGAATYLHLDVTSERRFVYRACVSGTLQYEIRTVH